MKNLKNLVLDFDPYGNSHQTSYNFRSEFLYFLESLVRKFETRGTSINITILGTYRDDEYISLLR